MAVEQWIRWERLEHVSGLYYLESFSDSNKELVLILTISGNSSAEKQLKLCFEAPIYFYRLCDETARSKIVEVLAYDGLLAHEKGKFFKVVNSTLIHELSQEHASFTPWNDAIHFSIVEIDWIIEVITTSEPKFIWL